MSLAKQLNRIKYSLISERENREDISTFPEKEYRKLFLFMRKTIKELMNEPEESVSKLLPEILEPTLRLKTKRFITENCPSYAKRLKK